MISCTFKKVLENNRYQIKSGEHDYELTLEFYGVDKPKVGDKMLIHKDLFDKRFKLYTQPYSFEKVEGYKPKLIKEKNDAEFIVLGIGDKIYTLKRIYG